MSDRLVEIDTTLFVARIGEALIDRDRVLSDGSIIRVARVEFVIEHEGEFYTEGPPTLRRQGINNEYPLAIAVGDE